jgi:hypothetical protein
LIAPPPKPQKRSFPLCCLDRPPKAVLPAENLGLNPNSSFDKTQLGSLLKGNASQLSDIQKRDERTKYLWRKAVAHSNRIIKSYMLVRK